MLVVRVGLSLNPKNLITTKKTMIMKKIENINRVLKRVKIINFIKSIALGVVFVEEGLVPLLTIKHRNIFVQSNLIQD
jgi:hypothetical protein